MSQGSDADTLLGQGGTDTLAGNEGNDSYNAAERTAGEVDDDYLPSDYPFDWEDRDNLIDPLI